MNLKRYREQLTRDLERWIANGWVPAASRELILADIPAEAPGRTALWLGMIGATLAGLAVIAGIADNWAVIPRALKLGVLLALLWATLGGAAWAATRGRPNAVNALTLVAALIFAASIGLLGQSLNIPGDPNTVLLVGAVGAGLLTFAGASSAAGLVYLVFAGLWYWNDSRPAWSDTLTTADLYAALFLLGGLAAARLQRSRILGHASLLCAGPLALALAFHALPHDAESAYAAAGLWGALGAVSLIGVYLGRSGAGIPLGWSAWHGLFAFGFAGLFVEPILLHRISWIAISIGVIALVARARQAWALAAGLISLVIACFTMLVDLGLGLGTAAAVFGVAALAVLGIAHLLKRRMEG